MLAPVRGLETASTAPLVQHPQLFLISLRQARIRRLPRTIADVSDEPAMMESAQIRLETEDMQPGALHERPSPYFGRYLLFHVDNPAGGREMLRRLLPVVASSHSTSVPDSGSWVTVALTSNGLRALGVPEDSLASFTPEFQQGMA